MNLSFIKLSKINVHFNIGLTLLAIKQGVRVPDGLMLAYPGKEFLFNLFLIQK